MLWNAPCYARARVAFSMPIWHHPTSPPTELTLAALDTALATYNDAASLLGPISYLRTAYNVINRLNAVRPSDFRYAWQRDPVSYALVKRFHLRVVRGPDIGRNPVDTIPGEPGIPRFATPGFAPGGELPVAPKVPIEKPLPPQNVLPGPSVATGGPISDTNTPAKDSNMAVTSLGSFLGGIGQDIVDYYGQKAFAPSTPSPSSSYSPTASVPSLPDASQSGGGGGGAGGMILGPGQNPGTYAKRAPGTVYLNAAGQVVDVRLHHRRRRRRPIMTAAQAAQLEMAKAVLGKGQAFQEWIAIRGRG